jgi:DNA-binding transcriptional regulator YiaG
MNETIKLKTNKEFWQNALGTFYDNGSVVIQDGIPIVKIEDEPLDLEENTIPYDHVIKLMKRFKQHERLRTIMDKYNITSAIAAKYMQIQKSTVLEWLKGKKQFCPKNAVTLLEVFCICNEDDFTDKEKIDQIKSL